MLSQYISELREEILKEYELGVYGYRLLAKRYGLKRDTVRDWVRAARQKGNTVGKPKAKLNREKPKDIKQMTREELEEELDLSRHAADFWEFYAKELLEQIKEESKKKVQLELSTNTVNKRK